MAKDTIKRNPKILSRDLIITFNNEKYIHADISLPTDAVEGIVYRMAEAHSIGSDFINNAGGLVTVSCYGNNITTQNRSGWVRAITPNNVSGAIGVNVFWIPIG